MMQMTCKLATPIADTVKSETMQNTADPTVVKVTSVTLPEAPRIGQPTIVA